ARLSPLQRAPARNQVIRHREVDVSSPEGPGFNFLGADLNESAFQKSRSSGTLRPAALCGRWSRTFHLRLNAPQTTSYSLYRPRRRAPARVTHALALLRARRERPSRRAAEQRDELAAPHHSITSSARASSVAGTSRPSAFAVLRLITSSNLAGAWTGSSLGFSPLRMRST